ncbi:glycoside hydrolase family 18 [Dysgonomonas massiliensis]|uniref:glycoside hydrolase family 18 n=1 Tax=Dysgonomonas massiliensis TaxID=2040292 RepID=UPI000C77FC2D|nr:glycoside hydrolase family 18 [Dysgonomonas massiliensis]
MKKTILSIGVFSFIVCLIMSCSDWTEVNEKNFHEPRPSEYYEALREWKKTDHPVTFGWFGNWTGQGASPVNCLMGLPDSVDFVSMWGNWHSLSPEKWADKNEVKRLKGTRVLMCFIVSDVGDQTTPSNVRTAHTDENGKTYYEVDGVKYTKELDAVKAYWGWDDNDQTKIDAAIAKYAKSIVDTIHKYEWDGFDFDFEPNYAHKDGHGGNIDGPGKNDLGGGDHSNPAMNRQYRRNFLTFIKELGRYLGPKSGTDKMLVIDGEPQNMHPDARDYFDYYIIQAYNCSSYSNLDNRYNNLLRGLEATDDPVLQETVTKKLIWTENFEDHAAKGGVTHTTRQGEIVRSLKGMAMWEAPTGFQKGGIGTYHMEYEYWLPDVSKTMQYPYLREATSIMNPPMTSFTK